MIASPVREKSLALQQQYGEVTQAAGETLSVRTGEAVLRARRAASCLLAPLVGDKVLLVTDHDDAYVLAVLERAQPNQATLELPGDTEIRTGGGRLRLSARDGIGLETASDVSLLATQLNVSAVQGEVLVNSLSFTGDLLRGCVDRIKLVGRSFDAVLDRYYQRVSRSYRHVDEIDQVKASQMYYEAKNTFSLHAKNTVMTADELVKVDAEQIHMG